MKKAIRTNPTSYRTGATGNVISGLTTQNTILVAVEVSGGYHTNIFVDSTDGANWYFCVCDGNNTPVGNMNITARLVYFTY